MKVKALHTAWITASLVNTVLSLLSSSADLAFAEECNETIDSNPPILEFPGVDKQFNAIVAGTTVPATCSAYVGSSGRIEFETGPLGFENINEWNSSYEFAYTEERTQFTDVHGECKLRSTASVKLTTQSDQGRLYIKCLVRDEQNVLVAEAETELILEDGPSKPELTSLGPVVQEGEPVLFQCKANVGVHGALTWLMEIGTQTLRWTVNPDKTVDIGNVNQSICASVVATRVSSDKARSWTIASQLILEARGDVEGSNLTCLSFIPLLTRDMDLFSDTIGPLRVIYEPRRPTLVVHYHRTPSIVYTGTVLSGTCSGFVGTDGVLAWQILSLYSPDQNQTENACYFTAGRGNSTVCRTRRATVQVEEDENPDQFNPYISTTFTMTVSPSMDAHYIRCWATDNSRLLREEFTAVSLPLKVQEETRMSSQKSRQTTLNGLITMIATAAFFFCAMIFGIGMLNHKLKNEVKKEKEKREEMAEKPYMAYCRRPPAYMRVTEAGESGPSATQPTVRELIREIFGGDDDFDDDWADITDFRPSYCI